MIMTLVGAGVGFMVGKFIFPYEEWKQAGVGAVFGIATAVVTRDQLMPLT